MTEETKTEAAPEAPKHRMLNTSLIASADTNQNDVKDWLKACPFSHEGGQAIRWENQADGSVRASIKVQANADTTDEQFAEWVETAPIVEFVPPKAAEPEKPEGEQDPAAPASTAAEPVKDDNGNPHPMEGQGEAPVDPKPADSQAA